MRYISKYVLTFFFISLLVLSAFCNKDSTMNRIILLDSLSAMGYYFPKIENSRIIHPGLKAKLNNVIIMDEFGSSDTITYEKIINNMKLKQLIVSHYNKIVNQGYLFAKSRRLDYDIHEIKDDIIVFDIIMDFFKGEQVIIHDLRFPGGRHINPEYLKKWIKFKPDVPFSGVDLQTKIKKLRQLEYLTVSDTIRLFHQDSMYFVSIPIRENSLIDFSLLVGYSPSKGNEKGQWNGDVLINFKNLFGSGRKLWLNWQKPNNLSELIDLRFQESYVFNSPIHIQVGYKSSFRDSLFSQDEKSVALLFPSEKFMFDIKYLEKNNKLDSALAMNITKRNSTSKFIGAGVQFSTLNNNLNPSAGIQFYLGLDFGTISGLDSMSTPKNTVKIVNNINLAASWNSLTPFLGIQSGYIKSKNTVSIAEQFFIGGSKSLRGVQEESIITDSYFIVSMEIRILTGYNSRFYLFRDQALFNIRDWLHYNQENSLGFGFLIPSKLGRLKIDYAITEGFSLSNGTIHVRLLSDF